MTSRGKRQSNLRLILTTRRHDIQLELDGRRRNRRAGRANQGGDDLEHSEADNQGEMALALLHMKVEMVTRIDMALARLDAGQYGSCAECEREISERRLEALPFAVRCQTCEETLEQEQTRARTETRSSPGPSVFSELRT